MTSNTDGAAQGEAWLVDIGDEGWQLIHESGRAWGLNKNYGHPEDLAKFLIADHRKAQTADVLAQERERLVGELNTARDVLRYTSTDRDDMERERNDLTDYASRLLAALTQQRQALELISNPDRTVYPGGSYWDIARAALATDHAALLAEGAALGVTP